MRMYSIVRRCVAIAVALMCQQASAQICCPSGCVQDGNSCVTIGANPRSCGIIEEVAEV